MLDSIRSKIRDRSAPADAAPLARRFVRQQDGAAAVEFALVALPFLALTFAILETALVFFAGQTLEAAVAELGAADHDRSGADRNGYSKDDFKTAGVQAHLPDCSTAPTASMSTSRPTPASPPSTVRRRRSTTANSIRRI